MHIAIIGAGFSGVASVWHLLQQSSNELNINVTVFDPLGIAGGTSGIAAGLLHPYVGAHAKLNWQGREGMVATQKLLKVATEAMGESVAENSGFLRIALTEDQQGNFSRCAQNNDDVEWYSADKCRELFPGSMAKGGIFIKSAMTVNTKQYLKSLWQACQDKGALLEKRKVESLSDLNDYDCVVVASGAHCSQFPELSSVKVTPVKGQILEMKWPVNEASLEIPFSSQAYVIANPKTKSCIVGATYERGFKNEAPVLDVAANELLPKATALVPALQNAAIIDCRAGVRASTPSHLPVVTSISLGAGFPNCWIITGMGSKGLLYHALYAEQLAKNILAN